jgi:hypothetical protein
MNEEKPSEENKLILKKPCFDGVTAFQKIAQ